MFQLFPKKPFALSITDGFVHAMQLKGDTASAKLQAIGSQDLESGVVTQGKIMKPDVLASEIRALLKKTKPNPIRENECVVTLPEQQTYELIFYPEKILEGQALTEAIESFIRLNVPVPFDALQYDAVFYSLNQLQIVYIVACRRDVLEQYDQLLREHCHIKPLAFEPESFSLMRTFRLCFVPNKAQILAYVREKTVHWFLFLNGLVFDSNVGLIEHTPDLARDLQKSIDNFQNRTQQKVDAILITGLPQTSDLLVKNLSSSFLVPVKKCEQYSIDLKDFDTKKMALKKEDLLGGTFSIVAGTALKTIGIELGVRINLFKK